MDSMGETAAEEKMVEQAVLVVVAAPDSIRFPVLWA
jgi:hypothetical protein